MDPFSGETAARGRPLFVHPSRELPAGEHFDDFVLALIVGRPTQTAVCAARLIFTGNLVWSVPALRLLVDVLGPERLLVGNDQPPVWFPLAESLALLDQLARPAADCEAIRWGNAARVFGIGARRATAAPA